MISKASAARVLWVVVWLGAACADLSRGAASSDAGSRGDTDSIDGDPQGSDVTLSFVSSIDGLLTPVCRRCHAQGQEAGDTQFLLTGDGAADYASVSRFISVSAPGSSRLLAKMSGTGHGGGTLYAVDSPEYRTVLRWIQEGAPP
jgi:hypothetical protein